MQDVFANYLVLTVEAALFTRTKVFMVYSDNLNTVPGILMFFFLLQPLNCYCNCLKLRSEAVSELKKN